MTNLKFIVFKTKMEEDEELTTSEMEQSNAHTKAAAAVFHSHFLSWDARKSFFMFLRSFMYKHLFRGVRVPRRQGTAWRVYEYSSVYKLLR